MLVHWFADAEVRWNVGLTESAVCRVVRQLGNLDLSTGVAIEARVNVKTEVEDDGKWQRRIMVLSSMHRCLFFWPGTRKYPKGKVARVRAVSFVLGLACPGPCRW